MRPLLPILITALLLGCASTSRRQAAGPAPAWSSEDGRLAARLDMAETMLAAGQPERALAVVALARQEVGAVYALDLLQARSFQALGMASEAAALLEPWLQERRRDAGLQHRLGLLRVELGELDEAERRLVRAAELDPGDPELANNLGFLLLVQGRAEEALPWLRRAVVLDPASQRFRGNLGFALAALGQEKRALEVFRSGGSEALAQARLGVAFERSEQRTQALERYRRALALDPQQPVALAGLARLLTPHQEDTP